MKKLLAGTKVNYTITWLEMLSPYSAGPPRDRGGENVQVIEAMDPQVWYFECLYDEVGRDYAWDDIHHMGRQKAAEFINSPDIRFYTLIRNGWPQGFYILDTGEPAVCGLAYFGLVEHAIGRGLGEWLLRHALHTGWEFPGIKRFELNTCTLDHPRAMSLYKRMGFTPVRSELRSRVLRNDLPLLTQ